MIESTRTALSGEEGRTVVAIDPATTANKDSDETGIVVACQKGNGWRSAWKTAPLKLVLMFGPR